MSMKVMRNMRHENDVNGKLRTGVGIGVMYGKTSRSGVMRRTINKSPSFNFPWRLSSAYLQMFLSSKWLLRLLYLLA